jgi:ech hydrogenase subunit D
MIEEEKLMNIEIKDLVERVKEFRAQGYRLVQIGCTRTDVLEINYSFDKDYGFVNLRITIPSTDVEIPSVSPVYWSAFLYENEISDLYGIRIKNMAVDYKGNFYRTTIKFPFNPTAGAPASEGDVTL